MYLSNLTINVLSKAVADDILIFYFFIFSEKIRLGNSCASVKGSHEMSWLILSENLQEM